MSLFPSDEVQRPQNRTVMMKCYICDNRQARRFKIIDGLSIYHCDRCQLYWVPDVASEVTNELYCGQYFNRRDSVSGYRDYLADEPVHRRNARELLRALKGHMSAWSGPKRTLLDLGCAHGFFLDEARQSGFDVCGVELSDDAATYAQEELHLDVRRGTLLEQDYERKRFDVVCMIGTLEHLPDPVKELGLVHRILQDDGIVVITTLNTSGMLPFFSWKPPEHLYYFNRRNIALLLDKASLALVRTNTHWCYYRLSDLAYRFAQYSSNALFRKLQAHMERRGTGNSAFVKIPTNEMLIFARKRKKQPSLVPSGCDGGYEMASFGSEKRERS